MIKHLEFNPLPGLASPHLQMIVSLYGKTGKAPHTKSRLFKMRDSDQLCCELSTPPTWQSHHPTVGLIHGLGGSHDSSYMIRLARKFYQTGLRAIRINLRGCGSGEGLSKLPYYSGASHDIEDVLQALKNETPASPIYLIGFSMGGNIILKMAGELGDKAQELVSNIIAICPVVDIESCDTIMSQKRNWLYHKYFLKYMHKQGKKWIENKWFNTIYDFNDKVIAPLWGYSNADEYYAKCSSRKFIPNIQLPCDLLFSQDDPFIDHNVIKKVDLSLTTNVWLTPYGGHMGFIGRSQHGEGIHWLDNLLINWLLNKI